MKKTPCNNNKVNKDNININNDTKIVINIDNKKITSKNEKQNNFVKKESNTNKNQLINKNTKNLNNQSKLKSVSILDKSKNKSQHQNLGYIPTIIFNLHSNKITLNSSDTKPKIKSKSNENNNKGDKKINCKKSSIINNTIKNIKVENISKNIIQKTQTQTQIQKKVIKNSNSNNLNKNIISKQKIIENISINNNNKSLSNHFYYNIKKHSGTTLSQTSNKKDLYKFINFVNKNNFTNYKISPLTIKNSEKTSKEKNCHNKSIKNGSNENKNLNNITCKLVAQKKKTNKIKKEMINKNYLKTFIKKFPGKNFDKDKTFKNKNNKNNTDISLSKITTTTKNSNTNLSYLGNFYSINFISKSFANKKNLKKKSIYKTKVETKLVNENDSNKISDNYFENISNQNIFPITISNYKNNYINININDKKNLNKKNNNTFFLNRITKNKIINTKNTKNANIKTKSKELNTKYISTITKTKITTKINSKYKIKESKTNKINNKINNTNLNNLKHKQISYFDLKKTEIPITFTSSSIIQNDSFTKSKEYKKDIQLNTKDNNNNIITNNLSITITKDCYYYQQESLKLLSQIKKYGKEHNYISYPETDMNYYKIGRNIGHGAFGKVNIALHVLSGHIVAIKSFDKIKKSFPLNRIFYEIKLLKKLRNHKNIIKYFEHFETDKYFCIVMENICGGNLLNAINKMTKFSEPMAKNVFKQLIYTIKYLHNKNIVHRDIKPDNILLELDNTIKLCDFGVSKQVKKGQLLTDSCGTPAFIAPEILKDHPYDPYLTDIWSSGVVLYIIVSGFFPFRGTNENELRKNIIEGNYPKLIDISDNLKDLLNKMLEINPNKRISLDEIIKHPWLNDTSNENNNNNINIFTKAEKIIYGKLKFDYRQEHKENVLENFTYKNILTEYEEENMNVKTISFIKTPYNSLRPRDDDEDLFYDDINIENDVMNFFAKVGEKNREYELRNNYDFDQGFIIAKKYNNKQKLMNSKNNSFVEEKDKQDKKNKNIGENNDKKIIENNDINSDNNKNRNNEDKNNINKIININENIIKIVENYGYNKEYIIKSLQSNEINHAVACYYLLLSLLNE